MCTDASVLDGRGAFAYCIAGIGDKILMEQHAPVHGSQEVSSTRAELMGILACIKYLHYLSSKYSFEKKYSILIAYDDLHATQAPLKQLQSIKNTFISDGDIIRKIEYWL